MENIKMITPKQAEKMSMSYDELDILILKYKEALELSPNRPKNANREENKKFSSWFDKTELKILNLEKILWEKD